MSSSKIQIGRSVNPSVDIYKAISVVGKKGFKSIEISSLSQDLLKSDPKKIKEILKKYDLKATAHFPFNVNFTPLNDVNDGLVIYAKKFIKLMKKIGVKKIVIHPTVAARIKTPEARKILVKYFLKINAEAKKQKIELMLENLFPMYWSISLSKAEDLEYVLKRVKGMKFCLDVGHANVVGKNHYKKLISKLHKYLDHMHISDNAGKDEHLNIGQGNIDFKKVFAEIKKYKITPTMTLELVSNNKKQEISSLKAVEAFWGV